ncbi:hypothetical protein VTK73DRAFT_7663 [Phialemonium thermophilum]|uniref:N-acetyltransferase domain-containing protein n=1 Tax=Phialemonium thermophilum TaxID=223376 RepID=A0ABR3Y7D4_9PEZI
MASINNDARPVPKTRTSCLLPAPILHLSNCVVRPYHPSDGPALAKVADDPEIARYMRNTFPSPYTLKDAENWIAIATTPTDDRLGIELPPFLNFAILACPEPGVGTGSESGREVADDGVDEQNYSDFVFAGGIGLRTMDDVESRTMELGYWLGRGFRRRGIASEAVRSFSRWAFEAIPQLLRIETRVFGPNEASVRLLSRCGYVFEGSRRHAVCKRGVVMDMLMHGLLREECLAINR